jgi:prefoldin subunit 5
VSAAAASGRKTFASLSMSDQASEIAQALRDINRTLFSIDDKIGLLSLDISEVESRLNQMVNSLGTLETIASELDTNSLGTVGAVLKAIALK